MITIIWKPVPFVDLTTKQSFSKYLLLWGLHYEFTTSGEVCKWSDKSGRKINKVVCVFYANTFLTTKAETSETASETVSRWHDVFFFQNKAFIFFVWAIILEICLQRNDTNNVALGKNPPNGAAENLQPFVMFKLSARCVCGWKARGNQVVICQLTAYQTASVSHQFPIYKNALVINIRPCRVPDKIHGHQIVAGMASVYAKH